LCLSKPGTSFQHIVLVADCAVVHITSTIRGI
jgi:hypothetical protein